MHIQRINSKAKFGANCYLLSDSGQAVVVDPSAPAASILSAVEDQACQLKAILLTHGHFDHIYSIDTLRAACPGLPLYVHAKDAPMLEDGEKNAFSTFFGQDRRFAPADICLCEGDVLPVGEETLTVLHTPGHSPGSVSFLANSNDNPAFLLTGDTLFAMGVGRCDLWGGDFPTLMSSLERLKASPPTMTIYPGHGPSSSLGAALDYARYM